MSPLDAIMAQHMLAWPMAQRLLEQGVPPLALGALNAAGLIGAGRVSLSRDGARFDLAGPDPRLLLGVTDGAGALVDIAALASHDEAQAPLLTGAGAMLGMEAIEAAHADLAAERPVRLRLHATPWDWLRAGGAGLCVLHWTPAVVAELRLLGERATLEVARGAGREIKRRLERGGLPLVAEDRPAVAGASLAERYAMGAV